MSQTAADKRPTAIEELFERFLPASNSYNLTTDDRELLAREVRTLASLGKTERWAKAIENWAKAIEDTSNDLHWAVVQYAVFAGHAAS